MHAAGRKDHPLSMRLQAADIAIIDRAAGLRAVAPTSCRGSACSAEEVLLNAAVRCRAFAAFRAAIVAPAAPVPELVELLRRPAPWEEGAER